MACYSFYLRYEERGYYCEYAENWRNLQRIINFHKRELVQRGLDGTFEIEVLKDSDLSISFWNSPLRPIVRYIDPEQYRLRSRLSVKGDKVLLDGNGRIIEDSDSDD